MPARRRALRSPPPVTHLHNRCPHPTQMQPQVDAEFDVSGKASEAARAAAEAAKKVNEAAEDADSKFQFRRKSRILWSDVKRSAPLVRPAWLARRGLVGRS